MDTATKTEIDAVKTASKRVVQNTAEATGDLIGNKIADKITSVGKIKILLNIKCNFCCIKMEFQKIVNLLDTTSDEKDLPKFVTKIWI